MTSLRVAYASASGPVVVEVAHEGAAEVALALFPDDRADDPGIDPYLTLRSDGDGFLLANPVGAWRSPTVEPLLVQMELALAEELVRRAGHPGFHAAGVVLGGGAVLFPGTGGTGKSSITVALARMGCPVLGDDVVILDPSGTVHPFRRLLKVEEPARTLLGLPEATGPLAGAWPDATFYRPAELGGRWADPVPVRAVVLLQRGIPGPPLLEPARASAVLPELISGLVLSPKVDTEAFDAVVAALASADCRTLRYDATRDAAEALVASLA